MKIILNEKLIEAGAQSFLNTSPGAAYFDRDESAVKIMVLDFKTIVDWTMVHVNTILNQYGEGAQMILEERASHPDRGYDAAHDDQYKNNELAVMAACYAGDTPVLERILSTHWPNVNYPDKRGKLDRVRELVIAGGFVAAEIDRLIRKSVKAKEVQS